MEPGRPVRSQLASAAKSPEEAFRRMKNKTFVVETKFDGAHSSALSLHWLHCQRCLLKVDWIVKHELLNLAVSDPGIWL